MFLIRKVWLGKTIENAIECLIVNTDMEFLEKSPGTLVLEKEQTQTPIHLAASKELILFTLLLSKEDKMRLSLSKCCPGFSKSVPEPQWEIAKKHVYNTECIV